MDSDLPVHDFAAADPDSVVTQDVMEDVVRENVLFSDILEEAAISENVIIPEQVLASDVTEEMSLTHCTMPHDILASDITTDSVSVPEHVFPSECRYVSDLGHVEHVVHDNVEAEIVTDILTSDLISEEVLVADCASEAVLNTTEIYVYQQNYDKGHSEDNLMISLDDAAKLGHNNITEKSIDTESENNPFKVDDRSPEIINVYSFKSDPGEDDIVGTGGDTLEKETENEHGGELFDQNSSVHVPREKMIYVTVNDSQPENMYLNISELTDDVCMGLIVGQEDVAAAAAATKHEQEMDNSEIKNFMPIEWETGHGTDSDGTKNQNTSASTPLQIDESAGISGLAQQTPKKMRRSTSRHYQTETIIGPDGHPLTVYLCMVCEKKFKSRSFLKKHMKMYPEHQTKKKYSCPDCPYSTNKEHSLQNHLESHKATGKTEKATESGESGKDFSHPGALLTHKVTQKEKGAHKTYKCKFCKYEAVEYALLNCHLLTVHRKNFPRICVECGKGFKHPSELKRHMRIHTGEKPFPCQYCEYKSADSSKLKSHVKTKHSKEVPFKCDTCLLIFSDSKEMQQHAVIHQESNNHQCLHCDHKSSTPNDLKLHVISVHTKDYPHKCDMCDRGFHQASDLKNHVAAVHKDTTTHPCKHCDFRIADPFLLSRHILSVHSQRLLYKCQRCQKEFQQQEELDNHVRTHSSKKVFKCEYCDYKTTDASGFKRHVISIHTKNYPHRCEYCQKGFRRPSEKKQHILRHHKEAVLPPEILRTETFIPSRQDRDPPSSSATGC